MKIFVETKMLVKKEKEYTYRILKNLMVIERDKLFSDIKCDSLHTYLRRELNYSDAEATLRVNAARLMLKSKEAVKGIEQGQLTLTNASKANQVIQELKINSKKEMHLIVEKARSTSKRKFKEFIAKTYNRERREILVLNETVLLKIDRYRKKYERDELSSYEVFQVLLEKELKNPRPIPRVRTLTTALKTSRYIPNHVKAQVNNGECANCGKQWDLEYDHIKKFSHGGTSDASNIQILCRSCNQRKEIKARQSGIFA